MPAPATVLRRFVTTAVAVVAAATLASCSTPASGDGTLDTGRERVNALLADITKALPAGTHPSAPATGTAPCRRKVLGYTVGNTGRHEVEAPILVQLDSGVDARTLLDTIESRWQAHGFSIDRSGLTDSRYPKLSAHTPDGYRVTATAILYGQPRLDLYAVSECLAGS